MIESKIRRKFKSLDRRLMGWRYFADWIAESQDRGLMGFNDFAVGGMFFRLYSKIMG